MTGFLLSLAAIVVLEPGSPAASPTASVPVAIAHQLTGAKLDGRPPASDNPGQAISSVIRGRRLFTLETFGGNGRTCETCHDLSSGTTSPADAQALYAAAEARPGNNQSSNLFDPLFRPIDSDDGAGDSYDRLLQHATIRVVIDLPSYVTIDDDPSIGRLVLNRGIPSMVNSALLLPVLMQDGRESTLQTQALDAVIAHAEPSRLPGSSQLEDIAQFERTLFSRPEIADYFAGGPPPELPPGTTAAEIRGRTFIRPGGLCSFCHSGPMLNETSPNHPAGPGQHFEDVQVSERNVLGNPVHSVSVVKADGSVLTEITPDPGVALIRQDVPLGLFNTPEPTNYFRIPTLWNVKATAPYFHDNSAHTLEDVLKHYQRYLPITNQDAAAIVAYLKLL